MPPASPASAASRVGSCNSTQAAIGRPSFAAGFDLLALAGRGSFAEVWKVRHQISGEIFALKQLRADRIDQPAARRMLENEAEIGRQVSSEFVVKIYDVRLDATHPYILLEWLTGQTLATCLLTRKRLFCKEALWIARQCAQAMHSLLVAGNTHGDIKPSNIFVREDGAVKLIDLGFARPDRLTVTELVDPAGGTLQGTPEFLAPETLVPRNSPRGSVGIARDIYSLGVTLYRMLTGCLPFQGETVADVLRQHQQMIPVPLRALAPEVPREVGELVHRLLSKEPLRRGAGLSWLIHDLIGLELGHL
jgi:serine/threonine-protein kinase